MLVPGPPAIPGLPSFLQESECFLTREMGYFSQYTAWVREEVSGAHTPLASEPLLTTHSQLYQPFLLLCPSAPWSPGPSGWSLDSQTWHPRPLLAGWALPTHHPAALL